MFYSEIEDYVMDRVAEMKKFLEKQIEGIETKPLLSRFEAMVQQKPDRVELENVQSMLLKTLHEHKQKFIELTDRIDKVKSDVQYDSSRSISESIQSITPDLAKMKQSIEDVSKVLETKVAIDDVRDALARKVSSTEIEQFFTYQNKQYNISSLVEQIEAKANKSDIEWIKSEIEAKPSKDSVVQAVKTRVSQKEFKSFSEKIADFEKEMLLKANIKDVITLLDEKSQGREIKTYSSLLAEVSKKCVDLDLYTQTIKDQAVINEALMAQNKAARWIWKSGKLKSGHGVPWNVQVINTFPDNFVWEKDRVNILVVQPGLYEVCFGFYAKKKPTVQLHINGEPVLSAIYSSSYVVQHATGKMNNSISSSSGSGGNASSSAIGGNITGLTLIDFIAIPEKARVAISYSGEEKAEGFMSLRKL